MEDRQLALVGAPRGADSALSEVSKSEALLELRRAAALSHHHRQIWVKDPHGGMYRKADTHTSSITASEPLGYEVVKRGSTTNIVGNHMTQAAIDLVQAELENIEAPGSFLGPVECLPLVSADQQAFLGKVLDTSFHHKQDEDPVALTLSVQNLSVLAGRHGSPDMASLRQAARLLRFSIASRNPLQT